MNGNEKPGRMHPGAWYLERIAFEEAPAGDEIKRALEHLSACETCAAHVETLRSERAAFVSRIPPQVFFAAVDERAHRTPVRPRLWEALFSLKRPILAGVAALISVGIVLVFVRFGSETGQSTPYPEISLKGQQVEAVGLSLFVSRDGKDAVPWVKGSPLYSGDVLKFGVHPRKSGYVTIVNIDDKGTVGIYHPTGNDTPARVIAGKTTLLRGSIMLDDFIGEELLVAIVSDSPKDTKTFKDAVRSAYKRSEKGLSGLLFDKMNADVGVLKIRKLKP